MALTEILWSAIISGNSIFTFNRRAIPTLETAPIILARPADKRPTAAS